MSNTDIYNRILLKHYNNSLSHSGVKGMKWGVRNYQNEDGTYTEEGKARKRERNTIDNRRSANDRFSDLVGKGSINITVDGGGGYHVDDWDAENDQLQKEIDDLLEVANDPNTSPEEASEAKAKAEKLKIQLDQKKREEQKVLKAAYEASTRMDDAKHVKHSCFNDVITGYYDTSYLSHHGILGMKWGIRRFQNKDGTLTAAGKKRYGTNTDDDRAKATKMLSDSGVKIDDFGGIINALNFSKEIPFGKKGDKILLETTKDGKDLSLDKADQVNRELKQLEAKAKELDSQAKQIVVDDLYDEGIRSTAPYYARDGATPPTREEFASKLKLEYVSGYGNDSCELWYSDGSGMYGDSHSLVVEAYGKKLSKHASVQG